MGKDMNLFRAAADYYDIDPRGVHSDDIPFYIEIAEDMGAKNILELGCGTGRVSIPIAEAGFSIYGIDLSEEMLKVFANKLHNLDQAVQAKITSIHGDMADFNLNMQFDLIIIPFRAFQSLTAEEQQIGCLRCVYDHLTEKGRFIVDVFLPYANLDESWIADENVNFETTLPNSGAKIKRTDLRKKIDVKNQVIYPDLIYYITYPDGKQETIVEELCLKYYYHDQIQRLLIENNFTICAEYGYYDKRKIGEGSEQIFVCKK